MGSSANEDRLSRGQDALLALGLSALDAETVLDGLFELATELQDAARARSAFEHWLCKLCADTADALDGSVIVAASGEYIEQALCAAGMPGWAAKIVAHNAEKGLLEAFNALVPTQQLSIGLRLVGLLVCPDPDTCLAGDRLSLPVIQDALDQAS